jgi:hypothetical protein
LDENKNTDELPEFCNLDSTPPLFSLNFHFCVG